MIIRTFIVGLFFLTFVASAMESKTNEEIDIRNALRILHSSAFGVESYQAEFTNNSRINASCCNGSITCDYQWARGNCVSSISIDPKYFGLLKAKYEQSKVNQLNVNKSIKKKCIIQ